MIVMYKGGRWQNLPVMSVTISLKSGNINISIQNLSTVTEERFEAQRNVFNI